MEHGGEQLAQSTSSFEIVDRPRDEGEFSGSQTVDTVDEPAAKEEKERVLNRIEREMETFRKGECSRFQASTRVANELEKWNGASDKEKGKAFDSYLAEINSVLAIQDEDQSATRGTSLPSGAPLPSERRPNAKQIRDEVEDLLDQVSREELEGEDPELRTENDAKEG